jgi:hypothetical protein
MEKPIYDYQRLLHDYSLISEFSNPLNHNFKHKHLWVKKATGLGVTEFFLRFMAWLCLKDDAYRNGQTTLNSSCWMKQTSLEKVSRRMYGMYLGDTLENQIPIL